MLSLRTSLGLINYIDCRYTCTVIVNCSEVFKDLTSLFCAYKQKIIHICQKMMAFIHR